MINTTQSLQLCTQGSPEQVEAHRLIDDTTRAEARRLEADSPEVVLAGKVCADCTYVETCEQRADDWMQNADSLLPRPLKNAAVVGRSLLQNVSSQSQAAVDLEASTSEVSSSSYYSPLDNNDFYDGASKSGLSELGCDLYDLVVHGIVAKDLDIRIQQARADITVERKSGRRMLPVQSKKNDVAFKMGAIEADLSKALLAAQNREGYGQNYGQSDRHQLVASVINGTFVSNFAGIEPTGTGLERPEDPRELLKRGSALVIDKGSCVGLGPRRMFPEKNEDVSEIVAMCLRCPVFVECGIGALFQPSSGIRMALTEHKRSLLKREVNADLRSLPDKPDFPEIHAVFTARLEEFRTEVDVSSFYKKVPKGVLPARVYIKKLAKDLRVFLSERGYNSTSQPKTTKKDAVEDAA